MIVQAYQGDYQYIENSVILLFNSWPVSLLHKKLKIDDRDFKKNEGPITILFNNFYLKRSFTCEQDIRKMLLKVFLKFKNSKSFGIVITKELSNELGFTSEKLVSIFIDVCSKASKNKKLISSDLTVKLITADMYIYYIMKDELKERHL